MLSLVRDQSTSVGDLKEATEPPIDDQFTSGFIGSNDEVLWKHLARLTSEDADRPGAITIERDIMFALDDISNDKGECKPPTIGRVLVGSHADETLRMRHSKTPSLSSGTGPEARGNSTSGAWYPDSSRSSSRT